MKSDAWYKPTNILPPIDEEVQEFVGLPCQFRNSTFHKSEIKILKYVAPSTVKHPYVDTDGTPWKFCKPCESSKASLAWRALKLDLEMSSMESFTMEQVVTMIKDLESEMEMG